MTASRHGSKASARPTASAKARSSSLADLAVSFGLVGSSSSNAPDSGTTSRGRDHAVLRSSESFPGGESLENLLNP